MSSDSPDFCRLPAHSKMTKFLEISQHAARAGGQILLDWQNRITAREKGPKDLVTEADLASQNEIRQILLDAFPDHDFLGEEDAPLSDAERRQRETHRAEYRWIVDPLDGTANYVHGLQSFAVSIALERRGQVIAGVVYDPILDECYSAEKGAGAWLNGKRLQTSKCLELRKAMVAASFSPQVSRGSNEITRFIEVLHTCQSVRRLGSCALNLSYVAAGRLDAYWTTCVKSWDAAAGILLVEEAGGHVSNLAGDSFDLENPEFIASATSELGRELGQVIRSAG